MLTYILLRTESKKRLEDNRKFCWIGIHCTMIILLAAVKKKRKKE
jgi:hypothetical protein